MGKGIGGHTLPNEGQNDEWLTPPNVLNSLGEFDLDPCAPIVRPWPMAKDHFTKEHDGLAKTWLGRVFLNPPYGKATHLWLRKMSEHGDGIALIFARTDTEWFHDWIFNHASGILFLRGRLTFRKVDGTPGPHNSGGPSCLVSYDSVAKFVEEAAHGSPIARPNYDSLTKCGLEGKLVRINDRVSLARDPAMQETMP